MKSEDTNRVSSFIIDSFKIVLITTNTKPEITFFKSLGLLEEDATYYRVISNLFDLIDLIELLKAFSSNKLNTNKEYNINDKFTAKIAQKNGDITLKIHFKNFSYSLYLDKFECNSLAAKLSKVTYKCELPK